MYPFYNFSIPSNQRYRPSGAMVWSRLCYWQKLSNSLLIRMILAIKLKLAKFSLKITQNHWNCHSQKSNFTKCCIAFILDSHFQSWPEPDIKFSTVEPKWCTHKNWIWIISIWIWRIVSTFLLCQFFVIRQRKRSDCTFNKF